MTGPAVSVENTRPVAGTRARQSTITRVKGRVRNAPRGVKIRRAVGLLEPELLGDGRESLLLGFARGLRRRDLQPALGDRLLHLRREPLQHGVRFDLLQTLLQLLLLFAQRDQLGDGALVLFRRRRVIAEGEATALS